MSVKHHASTGLPIAARALAPVFAAAVAACSMPATTRYSESCEGSFQTQGGVYGLGGRCTFTREDSAGEIACCAAVTVRDAAGVELGSTTVRTTLAEGQSSASSEFFIPVAAPGGAARNWVANFCH